MATDFAVFLRRFLTSYLAGLRGCSPNTIASYRDTFKLLIACFRDERSVPPGKLTLDHIDAAAITAFLDWLRGRTAQQRLDPQPAPGRDQLVLRVDADRGPGPDGLLPGHPRHPRQEAGPARPCNHLTVEQTRRLLAQPDRSTRQGRRDATLLATLYDTAARVQELADLDRPRHPPAAPGHGRR